MSRQSGERNWRFKKGTSNVRWIIDFIKEKSDLYKDEPLGFVGDNSKVHNFELIKKAIKCYGHMVHALFSSTESGRECYQCLEVRD